MADGVANEKQGVAVVILKTMEVKILLPIFRNGKLSNIATKYFQMTYTRSLDVSNPRCGKDINDYLLPLIYALEKLVRSVDQGQPI